MKKKIISVLLIWSLTAMTFAGCRNVTDETAANTDVQSEMSSASDQSERVFAYSVYAFSAFL